MSVNVTIAPKFGSWREEIVSLPRLIDNGKGELLYGGRNKVWLFSHNGEKYVVKAFRRLGLLKGIAYTFFRKNKARRAFENGMTLLEKGVRTPVPIAVIEEKRYGLYHRLYYASGYTGWKPIRKPLTEDVPFNMRMTTDYARFVASLHKKGIIHKDLNNTNVLYHLGEGHYEFMLIDINRMAFTTGGSEAPLGECLENITLFADRGEMFDTFADEYVKARGWDKAFVKEIYKAKARHDRHWHRKKAWKHLFSKKHGK